MSDQVVNNTIKAIKTPLKAKVKDNIKLSEDICQITIECPEIAQKALPGQFVSILCNNLTLRRPFSIADAENDSLKIIYKVKGEGTRFIANLKQNEDINLIGPLGNGFDITDENSLLLGGGVGIAPLVFLSKVLENKQIPYVLMTGFRSMINIPGLNNAKSHIITDDNTSSKSGTVIDYLPEFIEKYKPQKIYACGPEPVLKYTVDIAEKYNVKTQISLEKTFACGTGVCMGCSIQIKENNEIKNKRICKDGPVFDGRSIIWK